jgi:hypothetical protein
LQKALLESVSVRVVTLPGLPAIFPDLIGIDGTVSSILGIKLRGCRIEEKLRGNLVVAIHVEIALVVLAYTTLEGIGIGWTLEVLTLELKDVAGVLDGGLRSGGAVLITAEVRPLPFLPVELKVVEAVDVIFGADGVRSIIETTCGGKYQKERAYKSLHL